MGSPTPITAALLYAVATVLVPSAVSAQEGTKPALPSTLLPTSGSPWPDAPKPGKPVHRSEAAPKPASASKPASANKSTPSKPTAKTAGPADDTAVAATAPLPPVREPATKAAQDRKPAKAAAKKEAPSTARAAAGQPAVTEPVQPADGTAAAEPNTARLPAGEARSGVATARMSRWEAKARRRAQRRAAEAAEAQDQAATAAAAPVVQASAATQATAPAGGFDIVKFLSGQPQQSQPAAPQAPAALAPEELPEAGRRGRWHSRDRDRAARAAVADLIAKHARTYGIPVGLADAVIRVESRYNPNARNGPYIGLSQIHPATARSVGYGGPVSGLYDADTNLRYGLKYLAMAYQLADGDTCRTILKYQAGHRAMSMTRAAAQYCARVRTMMASH
ncbi:lytic transglycosylase domain-containing protein [Chelatococcus reniformis]|uniref:Transglycosylase SLT domain-containing protein n=1 Tax=Chelatococcus reniformis TaxID=1494448 RepID=A0A916XF07_9HYPH|nr:lytic transglycosylase domain-containing protein [Chelatococcus reniformis]GGC67150.1 hypothetical protein GCM10010994_27130 [Chelatococcus reniformis]